MHIKAKVDILFNEGELGIRKGNYYRLEHVQFEDKKAFYSVIAGEKKFLIPAEYYYKLFEELPEPKFH